jgi:hypothetical protein
MVRKSIYLMMLLALMLAGCAGGGSATQSPATTEAPTTPSVAAGQPTAAPGCTVRTRQSQPDPTLQALLPPPTDTDWVKGPSDAYVTLIEYSDFM